MEGIFGLPVSRIKPSATFIYKIIQNVSIGADVFISSTKPLPKSPRPIIVYIHGGGWTGGSRANFSPAMFTDFLKHKFTVVSIDYRLLPESAFVTGQLEDIQDAEIWLRDVLPDEMRKLGWEVDPETIIVSGTSAGGHLALLTPKIWKKPPTAILAISGATDMHRIARHVNFDIPPLTSDVIKVATFETPPTFTLLQKPKDDTFTPRTLFVLHVLKNDIIAEYLLRGTMNGKLPAKGCVSRHEIDDISPIHLCKTVKWVPTYQLMAGEDPPSVLESSKSFQDEMDSQSIPCKTIIVPGLHHGFDGDAKVGGDTHMNIIRPAVEWVVGIACA
ncbi:alpha/beta-hydrolase [Penicillium vulpinum]|uniref:BD-FAE-like domain-containing protein n=1 Tax=Penicillium vulpinum TaxID=29845 RepID=A0A1V6RZ59_9EURO|nr:alpha/beta-hydrolase [Penicillium vulpinum]KAJ5951087.1 alpha/beta-hydrolase [Penicillium vulpinum]OQE06896.1 hypothetical protein PENVUL_c016G00001 [Penicillium vulpinum]